MSRPSFLAVSEGPDDPVPPPADNGASGAGTKSGVGVLDKCMDVLAAVRRGSETVSAISHRTGFGRPTTHRLVSALMFHRMIERSPDGTLRLGTAFGEFAASGAVETMIACGPQVLVALRDSCGESAQVFRRLGDVRLCVCAAEVPMGLKNVVPVGTFLPMTAGSAAQVLLAWEEEWDPKILCEAAFTEKDLEAARRRGWATSVGQRDPSLVSVSAPVFFKESVIGAVCVAGPRERMKPHVDRFGPAVVATAEKLTTMIAERRGLE